MRMPAFDWIPMGREVSSHMTLSNSQKTQSGKYDIYKYIFLFIIEKTRLIYNIYNPKQKSILSEERRMCASILPLNHGKLKRTLMNHHFT
jgi:hypothetical protein